LAESAEEREQEPEASESVPSKPTTSLAKHFGGALRTVGHFIPKLLLFLFMLILPLALIAYPAWRISARLIDFSVAKTVEAELKEIDIRVVELGQDQASLFEARKHYDVVFYLKGDGGKTYASTLEMSWPEAGLKRKLENQYPAGEKYTLYLMPDQSIELDDVMAKNSIYRLTGLMGLVYVAFAVFFMLWKRLAHRWPALSLRFPSATVKSFMVGQFVSLAMAALLAALVSFSLLTIPILLYIGVYWGLVIFISLTLRLLVFESPPEREPVPEEPQDGRRTRPGDAPRR
jgi:hypothetical protein